MKKRWIFLTVGTFALSLTQGCGNLTSHNGGDNSAELEPAPWELVEEGESPPAAQSKEQLTAEVAELDTNYIDSANSVADSLFYKTRFSKYPGVTPFELVYNDSNKYQYAAGERIGITPIRSLAEAYFVNRPLVQINSGQYYTIQPLTHSIPYLVPEAAKLLETIGKNFQDSLKSKNLGNHKFYVTSLLRSAQSVKSLRRVNRNATDSSTHQLGTTFDLAYSSFEFVGGQKRTSDVELKFVLAEVLRDLKKQKKCMVKYEKKTPCFHITATGR